VNSDERALEAVVIARQLRSWGHRMHFVAVEEAQERLTRKHVVWLSATLDKQFPTLDGSEEQIVNHLAEQHQISLQLADPWPGRAL
jgi:CheY-like chemotaxis protein